MVLFVSALKLHGLLPICHQMIIAEVVLLWKLCNGLVDIGYNLQFSSRPTRSSTQGLLEVPKTNKISTEANFFVRATRSTNELTRLGAINLHMPLSSLKTSSYSFFTRKIESFNYNNLCCCFVKLPYMP